MKPLFVYPEKGPELVRTLASQVEKDLAKWMVEGLGGSWRETSEKCFASMRPPAAAPSPKVPTYLTQQDSATGHAGRMCFTSSVTMALLAYGWGGVSGPNADDQYLARVLQYGDTTSADAQRKALAHFGIDSQFRQDLDFDDLDHRLEQGLWTVIGVLHHGPVSKPSGGGHYIFPYARTATGYMCHDPFGELDLLNGGWANAAPGSGLSVQYSRSNLGPRWMVEGAGSGWGLLIARPR